MSKWTGCLFLALLLVLPVMSTVAAQPGQGAAQTSSTPDVEGLDSQVPATITRIRALDKITARITELDLPQDQEVRFGTLVMRARTCRSRPPEETPETFAFLEVDDLARSGERVRVFTGWMMASSPALNAMEHPVYDVWVISCTTSDGDADGERE